MAIDRTANFVLTWSSGGAGAIIANARTIERDTGRSVGVQCTFNASDNKGTFPAAALAKLAKADGTTTVGDLFLLPVSTKAFAAGDFDVKLVVTSAPNAPQATFTVSK